MNYTAGQQRAIESDAPYLCVDAGAGSGKTRVLVDRIVHLLRTGKARLEDIVAITFTEKAALEMKERLRRAFRKAAPKDDPDQFSFWRDLERRVDTAHITTIHAFCSRLLRENALYLGIDPDFGMLSDAESALMVQAAVDATMLGLLEQEDEGMLRLASTFSLSQLRGHCRTLLRNRGVVERIRRQGDLNTPEKVRAAWEHTAEVEQARFLRSLGNNASVNHFLLALRTFDGACNDAEENREYWRFLMVDALEAIQNGLGIADTRAALERMAEKPPGRASKKAWLSEEVFAAISKLQDKVREFARGILAEEEESPELTEQSAQLTCDLLQLDLQVNIAFAAAKEEASLLDFDDLVLLALRVLREYDDLRSRTAARIRYLMLDEFQDTDGQQLEIAHLLHGAERGPDLFIVGDPKQSIYYFRGADVSIFQTERGVAAEVVELDENFRSLPGVLGFANDFFAQSNLLCAVERYHPMKVHRAPDDAARTGLLLTGAPEGEKWIVEDYRSAEAAQIAAHIQRLCGPESDVTVFDEHTGAPRRPEYGDIALLFRATSNVGLYEEALRRAGIPYQVVAGQGFYERQEVVDVINLLTILADPWDEHALLAYLRGPMVALPDDDIVRLSGRWRRAAPASREEDLAEHVTQASREEDLAKNVAQASRLCVRDSSRGEKQQEDLAGNVAQASHLCKSGEGSEQPSRQTKVQRGLAETVLGDAIPEGLQFPDRLERARHIYRELRNRLTQPLPELVDGLLEISGLEAIVLSQYLGLQKASNLRKLATVAREQAIRGNLTLRQFVRYLDDVHLHAIREGEAGLQPEGAGAVTLMTIHKSKGLEFPVVFIPDMAQATGGNKEHTLRLHRDLGIALRLVEDEGDPGDTRLGRYIKRRIKEEEDAESARVLYVALTRARDLLFLCGQSNAKFGSWFSVLDAVYRVSDRAGGEVIRGKDWQAQVFRGLPEATRAGAAAGAPAVLDVEAIRARVAPVEPPTRPTGTIAVSRLLDLLVPSSFDAEDRADDGQPRAERDSAYAMDRGTLVHRMFELWDFSGDAPDIPNLIRAARLGLRHREQLQAGLERIRDWFVAAILSDPRVSTDERADTRQENLAKNVAQASRLCTRDASRGEGNPHNLSLSALLRDSRNLLREHPFSLRIGNTLVNGTIDLTLSDGTLIDYKTGKVKEATSTRYEKQLLLYAAAMRELTGTLPERGLLVYVDAGTVVEVALDGARVDGVLREAERIFKQAR